MKGIRIIGLVAFVIGLMLFVVSLGLSDYSLDMDSLESGIDKDYHFNFVEKESAMMKGKTYTSMWAFFSDYDQMMSNAQSAILNDVKTNLKLTTADGDYWSKILKNEKINKVKFLVARDSAQGFLLRKRGLFLWLSLILICVGALMYIFPSMNLLPGIKNDGIFHSGLHSRGALGITIGIFMTVFYIVLYWFPHLMANWVVLVQPIKSMMMEGKADQWFLYGFIYTIAILIMGIRFMIKYRHNKYQLVRTFSVMFFQLCFAFALPNMIRALQGVDLKNAWPLDYSFFFEYRINALIEAGTFGLWLLVWGIVLMAIVVPIITYFYGKRWYCSWVCGCGGLAETLGDPFRQQSDKSLKAWKIERYLIHFVLVFAVVMTILVVLSLFTDKLGFSYNVRAWYGFFIGSIFAGVIGTGFYPLMGNRVWCRFGCPLAAYMGLIQRIKSRFRITVNGGQCISCGNCSTYCEMGIDVRHYAQRGQDIVRSSCVGCGICAAVCPRGVLKLENGTVDIDNRGIDLRTIHVPMDSVGIL